MLGHFSIEPHRINVHSSEENGDYESSHCHFKDNIDQRLRLRGSRDFATLAEYKEFMNRCIEERNRPREKLFSEEQEMLSELPLRPFPTYPEVSLSVSSNSIFTVKPNCYSVPSCLIGLRVQVRVHADEIELWYSGKRQFSTPRLTGIKQEFVAREAIALTAPGAMASRRLTKNRMAMRIFRRDIY
ncbi:MAG: hypothetical protein U0892_16165 [Pirellulales bacterium]